jgi:hypothetical protein
MLVVTKEHGAKAFGFTLLAQCCRSGRRLTAARENGRPFGEPRSSEEPWELELRRAHEHDRGRHATHPLQIPWKGWRDILWRTYHEMQSDRLLSIAGGVAFFVLLAIFPAITRKARKAPPFRAGMDSAGA